MSPLEAAGKYDTYCVTPTGATFVWTNNDPSRCGGHLLVYISGKLVGNENIGATAGNLSLSCVLGIGTGIYSLFFSTTPVGWATLGAIAITGIGCAGW